MSQQNRASGGGGGGGGGTIPRAIGGAGGAGGTGSAITPQNSTLEEWVMFHLGIGGTEESVRALAVRAIWAIDVWRLADDRSSSGE